MLVQKRQSFNYRIIWSTRRYLVIAVVLILISVGLGVLAIYPQVRQIIALASEYSKEEPKLERLKTKLVELQSLEFTSEFGQAPLVNEALPSKKPLLEFLTSLNSIATANSIIVSDFKINPGIIATDSATLANATTATRRNQSSVDSMDLQLEIQGTFDELQQFLLDIEKISPFTTITALSLGKEASAADRETGRLITAELTTKTYFFTQSIKATVEAPLPKLTGVDRNVLAALSEFRASDLPEQTEIIGGGLEDPFGVDKLEILEQFRNE